MRRSLPDPEVRSIGVGRLRACDPEAMRTPTLAAGLAVLLLAAGTGPADAETRVVARAELVAGPQLAGGFIVWGERARDGGLVVRRGAPGRRPGSLFRFAAPTQRRTSLSLDGLAASATHLAMVRTASLTLGPSASSIVAPDEPPRASSTSLVAGPLGGPFVRVAGRREPRTRGGCEPGTTPREPALAGTLLVFVEAEVRCGGGGERVVERIVLVDLAHLERGRRVVAAGSSYPAGGEPRRGVGRPRVAGHYVAWQADRVTRRGNEGGARVLDLRSGRIVQSVDRVEGGSRGDILEWFAVGADGTLVLSFQPDAAGHRLALRRRDGRTRVLPELLPSGIGDYEPSFAAVSHAGGRTAFVGADGAFVVRGRAPRTLARFTAARPLVGDPSFDGRFAAWASRRGGRTTIYRASAG